MYSFQIEYLGAKPNTKVLKPNFDDLESLEFKKLKKYYQNAEALRVQVLALPEGEGNQKINELNELEKLVIIYVLVQAWPLQKGVDYTNILELIFTDVTKKEVTVDYNHPMAGCDLDFKVVIVKIV